MTILSNVALTALLFTLLFRLLSKFFYGMCAGAKAAKDYEQAKTLDRIGDISLMLTLVSLIISIIFGVLFLLIWIWS